jgi:hypothetical protein
VRPKSNAWRNDSSLRYLVLQVRKLPVAAPAVPIFAVLESLLPTCFWRCRPCELSDETVASLTRDSVSSVSASGGPSR